MWARKLPPSFTVCCKIFESLVIDDLMSHLLDNGLLNPSQHGFMSKKSCMTNLLEFFEVVTSVVDNGDAVDAVFLDFPRLLIRFPGKD
jgi:hypothetical protein